LAQDRCNFFVRQFPLGRLEEHLAYRDAKKNQISKEAVEKYLRHDARAIPD
jgi:hypothetical protein